MSDHFLHRISIFSFPILSDLAYIMVVDLVSLLSITTG